MRVYFNWRSMPELSGLSPGRRRIAWRECYNRTLQHPQAWIALGISILIAIGVGVLFLWSAIYIGYNLLHLRTKIGLLAMYFIAGFGCGGVIVGMAEFLRWRIVADQIIPYLQEYLKKIAVQNDNNQPIL